MLKESKRQGVTLSVATPHFYFDKDIDKAVAKREKVFDKLMKYLDKNKIETPEIVLGFEVYLAKNIYDYPDLDKLVISGTDTMLVEMPREKWNDEVFARLDYVAEKGYKIVIAHPERYLGIADRAAFDRLFSYGFAGQLNSASLILPNMREFAYKLIEQGRIDILGSDAHNNSMRSVFYETAIEFINGKFGEKYVQKLNENAEKYLCLK